MIRKAIRFVPAFALLTGLTLVTSACGMFYDNSGRKSPSSSSSSSSSSTGSQSVGTVPREPFVAVPPPGTPVIPVPASGLHKVERGNTVYSISRLYGVPVRAIIETNGLTPPFLLKVGDSLTMPGRRGHAVAKGETVYSISRQYGVPMNELTRANGIAPPYTIGVGQELVIPGASTTQVAAANPKSASGETVIVKIPLGPAPTAGPTPMPTPTPTPPPVVKATPKQIAALPKPPARASSTFLWPIRGKVISRFGVQQGGRRNDGINIGAKRGTTVKAAENGVVAYAGNELRGFGNLLLIKHADGYMTAYAHNEALLVGRGAKVKKGQSIARVGSTGSVGSPQLHFEIRKGRKSVDPLRYLPRKSASN